MTWWDRRKGHDPDTEACAPEVGVAGASARARYDALRRRDDDRLREAFGRLAPLARLVAGPKQSTEAWRRGADGEERVGALLRCVVGTEGIVLHDRSIPHRRSNLDHIAVVASGVWVIDSKHYRGRPERRKVGGWFRSRPALYVAGRDRSDLVASALGQLAVVSAVTRAEVPVHVALCFTGTEWPPFSRPFTMGGVLVTWPRALGRALCARGPLDEPARSAVAARLAAAFPPYAPSGTSHRPTGAPPSG
jgi:hypothetical protein